MTYNGDAENIPFTVYINLQVSAGLRNGVAIAWGHGHCSVDRTVDTEEDIEIESGTGQARPCVDY